MPKLPQHIEERFDNIFGQFFLNVKLHHYDIDEAIKSFIATILEEEKKKAFISGYYHGNNNQIDWNILTKDEQDMFINLIKEDE